MRKFQYKRKAKLEYKNARDRGEKVVVGIYEEFERGGVRGKTESVDFEQLKNQKNGNCHIGYTKLKMDDKMYNEINEIEKEFCDEEDIMKRLLNGETVEDEVKSKREIEEEWENLNK